MGFPASVNRVLQQHTIATHLPQGPDVGNTPNQPSRRTLAADQLLFQGRDVEAIELYRQILIEQPASARIWYNLAYAYKRTGQYQAALEAYAAALAHGIPRPEEVHLNRAAILSDHLRRDDEAESELRTALQVAPSYPSALLNLGNLHEERGKREEAIDCYRRILALPARDAGSLSLEALVRLVQLEPPQALDDPLLSALQRAANAPGAMDDRLQANLQLALGRALDALGQTHAAFNAFAAGKRAAHRRFPKYDRASAEAHTRAITDSFNAAFPAGVAQALTEPRPLFVCGMFRAGSTLLEQVLSAHPDITGAGELELLPRMAAMELAPFPRGAASITDPQATRLAGEYHRQLIKRLSGYGEGRKYAIDKRPDNYQLIGLMKRLFPDAKIIHTRRHPLDTALSIYMHHLNPEACAYAGDLTAIGHHLGQYHRLMAHWRSLYPQDILDFDYDAFVASPERELRPLLQALDLPWNDACLRFHRLDNTVKTASYWQVRSPLYRHASGRWQRYRQYLGVVHTQLAEAGVLSTC